MLLSDSAGEAVATLEEALAVEARVRDLPLRA